MLFEYWILNAVLTSGNSDDETVDAVPEVKEPLCDAREEKSDPVIADFGVGGGWLDGEDISGAIGGGVDGIGGRRRGGGGIACFLALDPELAEPCRLICSE